MQTGRLYHQSLVGIDGSKVSVNNPIIWPWFKCDSKADQADVASVEKAGVVKRLRVSTTAFLVMHPVANPNHMTSPNGKGQQNIEFVKSTYEYTLKTQC